MSDITVSFGADSRDLKKSLDDIIEQFDEIQNSVKKVADSTTGQLAKFGLAFSGVKDMALTAFNGVRGIIQGAFDFVAPAAAIQRVEKEIAGITGSAEEAKRTIETINEWALRSLYTPTEMFKAASALMKSGISSTLSTDLVKQLATIAQGDQSKMDTLVAALAKGSGGLKGFNSEVMEAFSGARVDLLGALEKTTGLTGSDLQKKINSGINLDDVTAAIAELAQAGGALKQAEDESSTSWQGLEKQFENLVGNIQENLGMGLLEPLSSALAVVNDNLEEIGVDAEFMGKSLGDWITRAGKICVNIFGLIKDNAGAVKISIELIGVAFLLMRTKAVKSFAETKLSFASLRSTAATTGASFRAMWSTFALSCRAAMTAVKAAIISTGIGALVVGIGEAFSWAYGKIMDDGEEQAGEESGGGAWEDSGGRDRVEYLRHERKIVQEWKQYDSGMDSAKSVSDVKAWEKRINDNLQKAREELEEIEAENGVWSVEGERQKEWIESLEKMRQDYQFRSIQVISAVESQLAAEKKKADLAKKAEEAQREIERNRQNLAKMRLDWEKSEFERRYKKQSIEEREGMLAKKAVGLGAHPSIEGITSQINMLSALTPTKEIMAQINALSELRKMYVDIQESRENYDKSVKKSLMNQSLMEAEIAGLNDYVIKIKEAIALEEKRENYKSMGMGKVQSERMARRDIELERQKEIAGAIESKGINSIIKQVGVEVGNGGKSLGLSTSLLGESKKQSQFLKLIEEKLSRFTSGQVVFCE